MVVHRLTHQPDRFTLPLANLPRGFAGQRELRRAAKRQFTFRQPQLAFVADNPPAVMLLCDL